MSGSETSTALYESRRRESLGMRTPLDVSQLRMGSVPGVAEEKSMYKAWWEGEEH